VIAAVDALGSGSNGTLHSAFIVGMGKCLPNAAVGNDQMESVLGLVDGRRSRAKRITLRNNGIVSRHYAIDAITGQLTYTNAQLTAAAVRDALTRAGSCVADLDLLVCGTSTPDQIKPAHAHMVHGELGEARLEVVSIAGVCTSGMSALKHAYLSVRAGETRRAVSSGSELASSFMVARNFPTETTETADADARRPELAFEQDFLRWMLSDGAGAALVAAQPVPGRLALRIDWIEGVSLANELPVCMYSGAIKLPDGRLRGWREAASPREMVDEHYMAIKQDARLLDSMVKRLASADTLGTIVRKRKLVAADVNWFLPHYSSEYFRSKLGDWLVEMDFGIPPERWFGNLTRIGNVGAAAVYLMLEELMNSGRLERGQKLLCIVPESARFAAYYMLLTVV
jgi:3-oxoacyl-[acyl-carrier-protein] synthase III